ncbi:tRNA-dihydrouridine synthase 3 [Trypanosoma theileri]|uniref:tRNA-dihydrouridine(47) synthase [NAD(P)(+)] n=1 Tax=Trypanosoma theileri TaxID=67003 RepID=A0A1X0NSY5_9TRYP|nr:tRNA-dihydrouridine synthase 3 [Trypanosoma theileri]ORC87816.1 tRNA-dihydrouridine synthase 3 [Trypanosoma theileri]
MDNSDVCTAATDAVPSVKPCEGTDSVPTRGICAVKAEYLRPAPIRVNLDAEGRTRGMNKGAERQRSAAVEGTQRPTFEGESNFFHGEVLQRIKAVVRQQNVGGSKRSRDEKKDEVPPTETSTENGDTITTELNSSATETILQSHDNHIATKNSDMVHASNTEEALRESQARRKSLFTNKLVLAPLTTVGNLPFRRICKTYGADITVGEMALVYNLNRLQKSEWSLLRRHESEDIFGIQIAVSRPQDALTWAKAIETSGFSYDFVDINCGCPVDKLVLSGCGCGLWERKGNRLKDVVQSLAQNQSKPVTIKCRIGPDEDAPLLHKQIGEYEGWGASAVTIHGRSRKQRYTKLANWSYVDDCATRTNLPVTGNGDILSWEDVVEHREQCPHVNSYMIGRGALIKPWIFEEIKMEQSKDISSHERFEILRRFCDYGLSHWGSDERGVLTTRRFLCEWLSFLCRYVPVGLLERLPQRMNERPPFYEGRDELETLMSSDSAVDWIRISEMLLGPAGDKFKFTPKHKSNSYANSGSSTDMDMNVEG